MEMEPQARSTLDPFEIARAVADTVRAVPEIADLGSGRYSEAATYGPSGRVHGVVVREEPTGLLIEIHVVARYNADVDLERIAGRVRERTKEALARHAVSARVDVFIEDIV
ncbi:MAG: hypothetical protein C4334_12865 [Pyrinomonas sp.]